MSFIRVTYRNIGEGLLTGAELKDNCFTKTHPSMGGNAQRLGNLEHTVQPADYSTG